MGLMIYWIVEDIVGWVRGRSSINICDGSFRQVRTRLLRSRWRNGGGEKAQPGIR